MLPAWTPERTVNDETAARLIAAASSELAERPVRRLAEGWDSTVFDVDGEWAFRFPRRAGVVPGLRREIEVLARIAPALPLAIPVPEIVGNDRDTADPWPFVGSRLIQGGELAQSGLSQRDRLPAAEAMGRFLAALHGIETVPLADSLPLDPNGRGEPARHLAHTRERLASVCVDGGLDLEPAAEERVDDLLSRAGALSEPGGSPVVCHGDLHSRHVIVGPIGGAAGVIDWVDLCLADPAIDLSLGYSAFAGPARRAFFQAYGEPVDAEQRLRARFLGFRLSVLLADYARERGPRWLLAESLAGLARALAD